LASSCEAGSVTLATERSHERIERRERGWERGREKAGRGVGRGAGIILFFNNLKSLKLY
jgi:hypothetical protein